MTQSKSRRLLYQQARLIRIQWAVILALVCTIILMAIFLPKAKAVEETAAPTLELEPTSYVTPEIMPEPSPACTGYPPRGSWRRPAYFLPCPRGRRRRA